MIYNLSTEREIKVYLALVVKIRTSCFIMALFLLINLAGREKSSSNSAGVIFPLKPMMPERASLENEPRWKKFRLNFFRNCDPVQIHVRYRTWILLLTALQDCHSFTVPWASQENHARPQAFQKSILPRSDPRAELIFFMPSGGHDFLVTPMAL